MLWSPFKRKIIEITGDMISDKPTTTCDYENTKCYKYDNNFKAFETIFLAVVLILRWIKLLDSRPFMISTIPWNFRPSNCDQLFCWNFNCRGNFTLGISFGHQNGKNELLSPIDKSIANFPRKYTWKYTFSTPNCPSLRIVASLFMITIVLLQGLFK